MSEPTREEILQALVRTAIPLEVLSSQDKVNEYKEISRSFMNDVDETLNIVHDIVYRSTNS